MFLMRLVKLVCITLLGMFVIAQIWGRPTAPVPAGDDRLASASPATAAATAEDGTTAALKALIVSASPATPAEAAESAPAVVPQAVIEKVAAAAPASPPALRILRDGKGLPVIQHLDADGVPVATKAVAAAAPAGEIAYVTGKRVNFREGPSTGEAVVDTLARGEAVTLVGAPQDGWQKIRLEGSGGEGWMSARFLSQTAPN